MRVAHEDASKLASGIRAAHLSIDAALVEVANMTQSILEVCRASHVHPAKSQMAIEEVTAGLSKLVDARKGFVAAHRQIVKVQRDSDLAEIDFGCVGPNIPKTGVLRVVNG